MLHYVDLEKCRSKAENTGSLNYMKHLAGFISQGAELCHLDGGNRTDAIVGFLTNEIPLKADHYFYGEDENGETLYFILEVDTYFKDLTEEQKEIILDKGMLVTVIKELELLLILFGSFHLKIWRKFFINQIDIQA